MSRTVLSLTLILGWSLGGFTTASAECKAPGACKDVQTFGSCDHCGRCGCQSRCEKQCRIVCEMKEVKKTVWVVECEEFCTMLPRLCGPCANECHSGQCGACGPEHSPDCGCEGCQKKCDPCAAEKDKCYYPPKCGKARVKKKLVKKEVVCKVPVYKCVVVYCCPQCGCNEGGAGTPPPAAKQKPLPPAPAPHKTTQDAAPLPPMMSSM